MSNLTIVLLLKDRIEFNERFLNYYFKYGKEHNLLISDGSKKKIDNKLLNKIKKYKQIKYFKFPEDKSYKNFYEKIFKTVQLVKSEFILFAANDDFLLFKNIIKLLKFLKKNKSYIGAGGILVGFKLRKYKKKEQIYEIKNIYSKINLDQKNAYDRFNNFIKNFSDLPRNSIIKKKVLLPAYRHSSQKFNNNIELKDHFTAIFNVIHGRIKIFNFPLVFHQNHINSEGNKRSERINAHLTSGNFIKEILLFDEILSKKLKVKKFHVMQVYLNKIFSNYFNSFSLKKELSINQIINLIVKKTKRKIINLPSSYDKSLNSNLKKIKQHLENFINRDV